jgi:hypothetical protein
LTPSVPPVELPKAPPLPPPPKGFDVLLLLPKVEGVPDRHAVSVWRREKEEERLYIPAPVVWLLPPKPPKPEPLFWFWLLFCPKEKPPVPPNDIFGGGVGMSDRQAIRRIGQKKRIRQKYITRLF